MDLVAPASKWADLTDTGLPAGSADTILCDAQPDPRAVILQWPRCARKR